MILVEQLYYNIYSIGHYYVSGTFFMSIERQHGIT